MEKARAAKEQRQNELATIQPQFEIKNIRQARSPEVIEFCVEHLTSGGTWGALRRKLGLGPASVDKKWRELRHILVGTILPDTETEALQLRNNRSNFLITKLDEFLDDLEDQSESISEKNMHHYFKIKLDAMKMLMEQNDKEYDQFLAMKKLKQGEHKNQGVSIIFQNNYHIPRPGDNARDVSTTEVANIMTKGKELLEDVDE